MFANYIEVPPIFHIEFAPRIKNTLTNIDENDNRK